jgi:5-hydroxyisourate hydrolase
LTGRLTTHVLDTAHGRPAAGVLIRVFRIGTDRTMLGECITNEDGRCDKPLLEGPDFRAGIYELSFGIGAYFARSGQDRASPPFLGDIVLRFGVASSDQHYHVPLLVSPFGYSTYRGS